MFIKIAKISIPVFLLSVSGSALGQSKYLQAAIDTDELTSRVARGFVRWEVELLKIGVFVQNKDRMEILRELNEDFEQDRQIIEYYSGVDITLGLWGDTNPRPRIFVIAGTAEYIRERASKLANAIDDENFPSLFENNLKTKHSACFSMVKFDEAGHILHSLITVDTDKNPSYCLRRQLITSFGLNGTLPDNAPSILSGAELEVQLTDLDKKLIKELYQLPSK